MTDHESHEDIARVLDGLQHDHDLSQGRNALRTRAEPAAKRTCELENQVELDEPEK